MEFNIIEKKKYLEKFKFETLKDIDENIFMAIVGARKSGKGYFTHEAIYHMNKGKKFKHAYLFSSTAFIQTPLPFPFIPMENRFTSLDPLKKLIEIRMKTKSKDNVLIVIDDIANMTENGKRFRNSDSIMMLANCGRHINFSCITILHRDTQLPPIVRNSCSLVINFLPKTQSDLKSIKERYLSMCKSKIECEMVYNQVFSEKYQALVCEQYKTAIDIKDYCKVVIAPSKLRKFKLSKLVQNTNEDKNKNKNNDKKKSTYRIYEKIYIQELGHN